jgi:hypothetical protein
VQCTSQKLEQLEARMDEIADRVARDRTNAARDGTSSRCLGRLSGQFRTIQACPKDLLFSRW